ncbi:MAG TPA: pitrilysin family protein [Bryobacteraceae bacterium]|nr:pitrilysin family protein [Bryobacteraceae bacterium]
MRFFALLFACILSAADQPAKVFPLAYDQHDLANGLRLVTIPTDYPNVVALYIVVQTGSRNEVEPGKSGFAHLFEHMMFRGTKNIPAAKYEEILKEAGAASNASTSDDLTVYHITFSKEDLETMLRIEADRFQHLEYTPAAFKTETLAVLGEYNKNSSSPMRKLDEVMRNTAFDSHTYKHTTMGFLEDVKNMPNLYDYSREFFERYYKPEYTTILVVGDVKTPAVKSLVEKYWATWEHGSYKPQIPAESKQAAPRNAHVDWPTPTPPWVVIGFKGPAYSDTDKDQAALDILGYLGFSANSDLYQRLVIQDQKVDVLEPENPDHVDPFLFQVVARVKKSADMKGVEEQIQSTLNGFKDTLVSAERLDAVKRHLKYQFALGMDNSEAIASTLSNFIALRRTPETVNRVYGLYDQITPEDLRSVARKYLVESGRTVVTLSGPTK